MRAPQRLLGLGVVALVLMAAVTYLVWPGRSDHTLVVDFPATVGLYPGDDVRALGVSIGTVDSVTPGPDAARVALSYRSDVSLPADVKAAVLAPTLVTGRYIQLSPLWRGGPRLADGAEIPQERTAIPVEWGQITEQLTKLTTDLGPDGANSNGALSRSVGTAADNLHGQGTNLHETVHELSKATATLNDGRGDLFATVRNLQNFTGMLSRNDAQVGDFNQKLSAVSGVLAENRQNLSTTLTTLDQSLPTIQRFIVDNRDRLGATVDKLGQVTGMLAGNRQALADILQIAPTAVSNFNNIYDPRYRSLNGALALAEVGDPATFMCTAIFSAGGTPEQCKQALGPLVDKALPNGISVPFGASPLNGLPPPARSAEPGGASGAPRSSAPPPTPPSPGQSTGGLLGGLSSLGGN